MPSVNEYLSAIRQYAPYYTPSQDVLNQFQQRADRGEGADWVAGDVLKGNYGDLGSAATNYLKPQFDAQNAALTGQLGSAQTDANYQTQQANTSYDRLSQQLAKTYQMRQDADPLAAEGVSSGAAKNFTTNDQVMNQRQIGDDLSSKLSYIANQLGNTRSQVTQQQSALQGQQANQAQDLVSGSQQAYNVGQQTAQGSTYQVNGNTYTGSNQGKGVLDLYQNPSFQMLLQRSAGSAGLRPVIQSLLQPYGINVHDDLTNPAIPSQNAGASSNLSNPAIPTNQAQQYQASSTGTPGIGGIPQRPAAPTPPAQPAMPSFLNQNYSQYGAGYKPGTKLFPGN